MLLTYTGKKLETAVFIDAVPDKYPSELMEPYLPDPELVKAVNLAIMLKRPLLLMGEPGSGKSLAARAVAFELYHGNGADYRDNFYEWHIKSTSQAKDGLYEYDALRRLRDAQANRTEVQDEGRYVQFRALGKAIIQSKEGIRPVVLIDEIDKADIDFPNDLLNEIDRGVFTVIETGQTYAAEEKPIIIITSNRERELPEAFLRRCIYYFIPKFDKDLLLKILKRRFFPDVAPDAPIPLLNAALDRFLELRDEIETARSVGKNLSTSELIDWFNALNRYNLLSSEPQIPPGLEDAIKDVQMFIANNKHIPLRQILFKNWETLNYFDTKAKKDGTGTAV